MQSHNPSLLLGAHTSIAGGVHNALLEGKSIGATTIQLFTSNQRQWKGRPLSDEAVDLWQRTLHETGLRSIMSHDSYLINLGSADEDILQKSQQTFAEEILRCNQLNLTYLNFHPGAAKGCENDEQCLDQIVKSLRSMEKYLENSNLMLLIEATAGQGSSVGHKLEHLAYIHKALKDVLPIGICIDTCHIFVAGYDIRTKEGWDSFLNQFDALIGIKNLKAFHLNDSLKGLGSRVDRHQPIGEGQIGLESFKVLMNDPRTRDLPKYLETPGGVELWKKEIELLRSL